MKILSVRVNEDLFESVTELSRIFSKRKANVLNDFVQFVFANFDREQLKDFFLQIAKPRAETKVIAISVKVAPEIEEIFSPIAERANLKITHLYSNILRYMCNFALKNPEFSYKKILLNSINEALEKLSKDR